MLKKIDHIGIAVADLTAAIEKYRHLTGGNPSAKETVATQKVETTFFTVGEVRLELLQGTTPESAISKFVNNKGPGIHHICFEVEALDQVKETLSSVGLKFIDLPSEQGAGGARVAFIHPKSIDGILLELLEYPAKK